MKYIDRLKHNTELYIGYPTATDFELKQHANLLDYSMNSLGNPYDLSNPFSSHAHEKAVIDLFIELYELSSEDFWGYMANCSTESILYCIWKARDYLKQYGKPIRVVSSDFAHYAIDKIVEILDIESLKIKSDSFGEIDYNDLANNIDSSYSYIVFATMGSTITSSIDDISKIKNILINNNVKHYIHADSAFDGAFIPFTDNFEKIKGFDSINISGHKFIGAPIPSGITIINKKFTNHKFIEYVSNNDITLGGSRDGLTPYLLYKRIQEIGGRVGLKNRYLECLASAKEFELHLRENNFKIFRLDNSLTLVIEDIPNEVMQKWHAPTKANYTTLTALPKLTKKNLDGFIKDVKDYRKGDFKADVLTHMPDVVSPL